MQFQFTLSVAKKPTEIERQQKQVIDVCVHLLKAPSLNRSPPKAHLFERF